VCPLRDHTTREAAILISKTEESIHGDEDRIVPLTAVGQRTATLVKGARLVVIKGGPHCITWTHADEVNAELLAFIKR
jgi:non-heme chloroperoxidase